MRDFGFDFDFSIDSDQRCRYKRANGLRCERVKGHDGLHRIEGIRIDDPEDEVSGDREEQEKRK